MHYGLDTSDYTFGYVAGWSSTKELPELQASLTTIQKTANEIISSIDEHFAELAKDKEVSSEKTAAEKESAPENETVENGFTELSDKDAAEGAAIFEQKGKSADTPTVDELEQKAKSGEPVSLMDLAVAAKKEKSPEKKPSIRKALKDAKQQTEKQPKKSAPSKKKEDLSL